MAGQKWARQVELLGKASIGAIAIGFLSLSAPVQARIIDKPFFRADALVVVIGSTEDEANGGVTPVAVDFNLLTPASSGTAAPDLIGVDGFVFNSRSGFLPGHDFSGGTSRLEVTDPISGGTFRNRGGSDIDYLDDVDTFTEFELDETTDINVRRARNVSRFLVASNAPFDIYAQASDLSTTGDFTALGYENIGFRSLLNRAGGSGAGRWGDAAQNPGVGGGGFISGIDDLGDISSGPTKLFEGTRKTARLRGTLLEQSVSFNIRYALSDSPNSSLNNAYDFSMGHGTIGAEVTYTVYTP